MTLATTSGRLGRFHPLPTKSSLGISYLQFDEHKCRNVLVRYCSHIPRNYQYRDGIRLIFLVLRDHLGDEHLGRAGGVLYEMIEIDCQHSDDPGAAFQRWKHDHMNRHKDLELPHVPHLTTITTAITPTAALTSWRDTHADRYHARLSDHSPTNSFQHSHRGSVQHRKPWMIEHTTFVSSKGGGTRHLRRASAQELHQLQWDQWQGHHGRLVSQKSLELPADSLREQQPPATASSKPEKRKLFTLPRARHPLKSLLRNACRLRRTAFEDDITSLADSLQDLISDTRETLVEPMEIPNANFARKFGLVMNNAAVPTYIKELPVAEERFTAGSHKSPRKDRSRSLQGPFTPHLWFDSGLDYRWKATEL